MRDDDILNLAIQLNRLRPLIDEVLDRYHVRGPAADPAGRLPALTATEAKRDSAPGEEPAPFHPSVELAKASMAKNTRRAYEQALSGFEGSGRPETDAGVAAYLGDLYEEGRSAAVAAMAIAALRFRARLQGRPAPVGPVAERVLAGFRRLATERGYGNVAGVSWEEADCAAALAERAGDPAGLRDAAIVAVASDALLRVSELGALNVHDVNLADQTVLIRRSKTDQEGAGVVQYLGEPTVARVRAWIDAAALAEGALFRPILKSGRVRNRRLTQRSIRRIIIRRARDAGVKGRISGHSLRVGSAQSLASAGASLVEMQLAGRWRSPAMPGRYARGQLAKRGAVARFRYGA
ncbi:MAG: tyrosine-type recombinase/integrase [Nitrospinae bacterium]|nr:tyrosine-type recombinase/integrase [Nitrospinota bacterium]